MSLASLYLLAAAALECRVVNDDVIRMRDLAAAEPVFSVVDGDVAVGYSPLPGSIRILQGAQLARLGKRNGIADGEFRDVCFQRAMRQLDQQELLNAFHHALAIPTAEVDLVDFSRYPAPVGDLVFPRSGLALSTTVPLLWKGYIVYGSGGHHFPVWARVRLHVSLKRVVATDNLVTGKPIRTDQLRIEPLDGVPDTLAPAQSLDQVVGKTLLKPVRRGATVSLDDVSTSFSIRRGNKVDVDFRSRVMHLRFEAEAEMDGRFGDRIRLRNPQSGITFLAEVSGKDQARVVMDEETVPVGADLRAAGRPCGSGREKAEECE
jgi:flagella basal body P-ring formation protein FlgA